MDYKKIALRKINPPYKRMPYSWHKITLELENGSKLVKKLQSSFSKILKHYKLGGTYRMAGTQEKLKIKSITIEVL